MEFCQESPFAIVCVSRASGGKSGGNPKLSRSENTILEPSPNVFRESKSSLWEQDGPSLMWKPVRLRDPVVFPLCVFRVRDALTALERMTEHFSRASQ